VGARRGQAVTSLEAAADARRSAVARAQDVAERAAVERATAAAAERAAASARRRVDELVAEQETLVRALADAESSALDAADRARELADRMAAAREVAARRARAAESARAAQIAAGRAVVPAGECAGADVSGYPNGQIPRSALCPLWGASGHVLRADAAAAFNALSRAYAAAWGRPVCVTDSYRSYEMQVELKARKPILAATPGTSNHGWGRAVDLCDGVNEFGTPTYVWMTQNAARFGWYHPSWAEPTGSKPEAWHWEFGV
jgi:hypothetical protein